MIDEQGVGVRRCLNKHGEWTESDVAQLAELTAAGTELVEAARLLRRRQTDVVAEAFRSGHTIAKAGPGKKWAFVPAAHRS